MRYLNDWIWLRLSNRYNVTSATHSLADVYDRWVRSTAGSLGVDLVDFYRQRVPDAESLNDAEYIYWSGGPLQDAVLWLDAQSVTTGHTTVPNLGSGGSVLNAQYGDGSTASTFPTLLEHTGENYVYTPGGNSNFVSTPHASALNISGAVEIVVRVTREATNSVGYFLLKGSGYATRCFALYLNANGTLGFWSRDSGGTSRDLNSDASITFGANVRFWVKVEANPSTGQVRFYTASDSVTEPSTWTQLGTTRTATWTGGTFITNTELMTVANAYSGATYRTILRNGIGGTVVFDANFATMVNGSQTTFTESSSNAATVTINRATTGRKTAVVTRPVWLFGTDDYLGVADNDLLDFGATDSFTVMAFLRRWGSDADIGIMNVVRKSENGISATMRGYTLHFSTVPSNRIGDGTRIGGLPSPNPLSGNMQLLSLHRDVVSDRVWSTTNGAENVARTVDTSTGTLANTSPLLIGGDAASGFLDAELFAVAVWRRALTAAEIAQVVQYYGLSSVPSWAHLVLDEEGVPILDENGDVIETE